MTEIKPLEYVSPERRKSIRRDLGLTQADMALLLNMTAAQGRDTVRQWESRNRRGDPKRTPAGATDLLYLEIESGFRPRTVRHFGLDLA